MMSYDRVISRQKDLKASMLCVHERNNMKIQNVKITSVKVFCVLRQIKIRNINFSYFGQYASMFSCLRCYN